MTIVFGAIKIAELYQWTRSSSLFVVSKKTLTCLQTYQLRLEIKIPIDERAFDAL